MTDSVIVEKSKAFALKVIKLCQFLSQEKREYVLSNQLLRSGTSIGANVREAKRGQSKHDFYVKMNIASRKRMKRPIGLNCYMKAVILTDPLMTAFIPTAVSSSGSLSLSSKPKNLLIHNSNL